MRWSFVYAPFYFTKKFLILLKFLITFVLLFTNCTLKYVTINSTTIVLILHRYGLIFYISWQLQGALISIFKSFFFNRLCKQHFCNLWVITVHCISILILGLRFQRILFSLYFHSCSHFWRQNHSNFFYDSCC